MNITKPKLFFLFLTFVFAAPAQYSRCIREGAVREIRGLMDAPCHGALQLEYGCMEFTFSLEEKGKRGAEGQSQHVV